jgi:hypothetical protein
MGREPRARVVPFPAGSRPGGPPRAETGRPATVYRPWDEHDPDEGRNGAWNELLRLVDKAWTWRDPETLNEIDACLLRLGLVVEAEWS